MKRYSYEREAMVEDEHGDFYDVADVDDHVEVRDRRITELEGDAINLAKTMAEYARLQRRCDICGSASHVGDGHASWCIVGKYMRLERARDLHAMMAEQATVKGDVGQ